ncbi:flagellin [Nitrobacteraceae bacterium AZCC 1564]
MSGIVLSASVRQNLLSLQGTADLLATTQTRLATGNKVNSALDNPTNYFTAQSLNSRASDINNLLDGIGNGVQVLQAANQGITSLQKLIDTAKSIANQALQATVGYSQKSSVTSIAINGATADNLLGTEGAPVDATYAGGAASVTNTAAYTDANVVFGGVLNVGSAGGFANASTKLSDLTDGAGVAKAPAAGDSFTVNGKTITFGANGVPTQDANGDWAIGLDSTIGDVLATIDKITGNKGTASSINSATGVITLHSGTDADVTLADGTNTPLASIFGMTAAEITTGVKRGGGVQTAGTLAGGTLLSTPAAGGGANGALSVGFQAGDTLQINGTDAAHTLKFVSGTANGANEISINDTVDNLLKKIDGLTGGTGSKVVAAVAGPPPVPAHVEIHTGTASDLSITSSNLKAAQALGLTGTAVAPTNPNSTPTPTPQVLVTTFARGAGTPPALEGKTLTIAATAGGSPLNIIFGKGGSGAGQVKSLNDLNNVLAANNLQASLSTDGKLTITTSNDSASAKIGAIGGTAAAVGGVFSDGKNPLKANDPVLDPVAQSTRASLVTQYNNVIDQIRTTAQDASFNGVNLLAGDQLMMTFNETGKSTLSITGVNFNPAGLGLGSLTVGTDFVDNDATNKVLTALGTASSSLRAQGSALGSNLSIVQIRQDFNKNLINVLQTGASSLTLADTNEEAANSQALSTRQSIAVSALALANQSQQSVLQLLR